MEDKLQSNTNLLQLCNIDIHRVIVSKNEGFAVGDLVLSRFGWVTHTVCGPEAAKSIGKLNPSIPLSPSTSLGILGMPG